METKTLIHLTLRKSEICTDSNDPLGLKGKRFNLANMIITDENINVIEYAYL